MLETNTEPLYLPDFGSRILYFHTKFPLKKEDSNDILQSFNFHKISHSLMGTKNMENLQGSFCERTDA